MAENNSVNLNPKWLRWVALILLVVAAILGANLPNLLSHVSSPSPVLGLYDYDYFAFIVVYVIVLLFSLAGGILLFTDKLDRYFEKWLLKLLKNPVATFLLRDDAQLSSTQFRIYSLQFITLLAMFIYAWNLLGVGAFGQIDNNAYVVLCIVVVCLSTIFAIWVWRKNSRGELDHWLNHNLAFEKYRLSTALLIVGLIVSVPLTVLAGKNELFSLLQIFVFLLMVTLVIISQPAKAFEEALQHLFENFAELRIMKSPLVQTIRNWSGFVIIILISLPVLWILVDHYDVFSDGLGQDTEMHMYLGKHILQGGIPYKTFIYMHPPMRFFVSLLGNVAVVISGLPIVTVFTLADLLLSAGIIMVTWAIGTELTRHPLGGLLAVAILLGTDHLQQLVIYYAPNFIRLGAVLLMLLGILMAQRKSYLWAGVFTALSALLWIPTAANVIAILIAIFLQDEQNKRKAAFLTVSGFLIPICLSMIVLLFYGALDAAYQQVIVGLVDTFIGRVTAKSDGAGTSFLAKSIQRLGNFRAVGYLYQFDWPIIIMIVVGPVIALLNMGRKKWKNCLPITVPLFAGIFQFLFFIFIDGQFVYRDNVMYFALMVPFGATAVLGTFNLLIGAGFPRVKQFLLAVSAIFIISIGLVDNLNLEQQFHPYFSNPRAVSPSPLQIEDKASQLDAVLKPDDVVYCTGNIWLLTFSNAKNALPAWKGVSKTDAFARMGWDEDAIVEELERIQPVLIMGLRESPPNWLQENYVYVGRDWVNQRIFVRKDRKDIQEVIESWHWD
jgi:hypothetical protein